MQQASYDAQYWLGYANPQPVFGPIRRSGEHRGMGQR